MELLLIRHAEPVRIGPGEGDGPADPPLTAAGREQADRLAAWLTPDGVDHVVVSPLLRARETAAPLLTRLGRQPEIDDVLIEYDARADHYIPIEELRETRDERWTAMVEGRWEEFGGEEPATFRARVVPQIDGIAAAHAGERVAVVCHGGVINVYLADVLGIDRLLWFDPAYTSVSRVMISRDGIRSLTTLNETAHLQGVRT
ncbi:MAG: histidine phosphatase family protein [Acidimicrobiia bacterium]